METQNTQEKLIKQLGKWVGDYIKTRKDGDSADGEFLAQEFKNGKNGDDGYIEYYFHASLDVLHYSWNLSIKKQFFDETEDEVVSQSIFKKDDLMVGAKKEEIIELLADAMSKLKMDNGTTLASEYMADYENKSTQKAESAESQEQSHKSRKHR